MELSEGDTTVNVYLNSLTAKQTCFTLSMIQTSVVESLTDATIEVIDYYEPREDFNYFLEILTLKIFFYYS